MNRNRVRRSFTATVAGVAAAATLAFVGLNYAADNADGKDKAASKDVHLKLTQDATPLDAELKARTSFAPMIKRVSPSVVQIFTTKMVHRGDMPQFQDPQFRRFFEDRFGPSDQKQQGLGSGVLVTADGYIVTNNHVIDGADEIKVTLDKSAQEYDAKLIGTDPKTDIALLKIEKTDLPAITFADSDRLEVGDLVFAIGNPMGVGQTVTSGIISATGRGGLGITEYENFIQTDAAINRGNSGGALVDAQGRLLGINTAIISNTGGNQGIGLSVPANLVNSVVNRIAKYGRVVRGFLGVVIQPVTRDNASFFKLDKVAGAIVSDVNEGGAAALGGIEKGDVIVAFAGKEVEDVRHLRLLVERTPPGEKVEVKVVRDGKVKSLSASLQELPDEAVAQTVGAPSGNVESTLGLELSGLLAVDRKELEVPAKIDGVLVKRIRPGSPAQESGVQPGDIIIEVNKKPVSDVGDAAEQIRTTEKDVLLFIWRKGAGTRYLVMKTT